MEYFEITDWFEQPGRWHLGAPKNQSGVELDPRLFTEGNRYCGQTAYPPNDQTTIKDYTLEVPFVIPVQEGTRPLDFTLGSFNMPVVTERIGEHLESCCAGEIQLIPAQIVALDRHFEILNVLHLVDAVDPERSEISWRTRESATGSRVRSFAGISRLVLKAKELSGARIFRLKDWESPLIVDQTVKNVLEGLHPTGVKFSEISAA